MEHNTDHLDLLLITVEPLLAKIVRSRLRGWPAARFDEMCQTVRIKLWLDVLPRFDPLRGAVEPFAARAIHYAITDELERLSASKEFVVLDDERVGAADDPSARIATTELLNEVHNTLKRAESALLDDLIAGRTPSGKRTPKSHGEKLTKLKKKLIRFIRAKNAA